MRTVLVTGATAGFGKAIAFKLAQKSCKLILTGRREKRLQEICAEINNSGVSEATYLSFDIRDKSAVEASIDSLDSKWQNIDVLVNNAGLALGKSTIENGDIDDWEGMLDTNVKGLLYITRKLIPVLKNSDSGHIINIGSIAGTEVYPGGNVYCASKHAVNALSKALRQELLPYGIRVSQIRPGLADTEFSVVRYKGDAEKAQKVYEGFEPLLAEDIARIAWFIIKSPSHVCINDLEVTPTAQASAFLIHKNQ
jgi:NADP-dependent 3-hydroxy acid dehydrogenase YdfG